MARIARLLITAAAVTLAAPALAHAQERTLTFTTPAISVEGYGVAQQPMYAESPSVDGYVVGMNAEVVDAAGRVQGRDKVMLHHIVFAKVGVPDYTCGGPGERFFAEGEERLALSLPHGYGYANKATDRWGLLYMLMNHKPQRLNGFIRYTVRYVTGEKLTPVKPVWLDVRNCTGGIDPVFDVPGGGKRFSTLHEDRRLHHARGRQADLRRRSPPRRWRPPRAAERDLWHRALHLASDLGWPEAEAPAARARADEDVGVPLDGGNPGRERAEAPARRGLRQPGVAHARDGDHAALPRARCPDGMRRDACARDRSR